MLSWGGTKLTDQPLGESRSAVVRDVTSKWRRGQDPVNVTQLNGGEKTGERLTATLSADETSRRADDVLARGVPRDGEAVVEDESLLCAGRLHRARAC